MDIGSLHKSAFEQQLASLLARDGWRISRSTRPGDPDLRIAKGDLSYVAEVKAAPDGRRSMLEALLADAVLRSRALARQSGSSTKALAVVAAPALSESMVGALREYVRDFAPDVALGLVDARGRTELHGEGLEGLGAASSPRLRRARRSGSHETDLFSDLNQWMLKILLGRYLPAELLAVPRERIESASDLARLAKVSLPSAWRFLSALKDAGFVEDTDRGLELVRRDDLMGAWFSAVRRPHLEVRAALKLPVPDPVRILEPVVSAYRASHGRIAWATFAASSHLGYQFVRGAPLHTYVEDLGEATLGRLDLVPAREHEVAHVILRRPRWPEAVFRSIVARNGQPVTDIVQCWLDVGQQPARGSEQAELLWRRVLAPAFGIEDQRSASRSG
jgi:hypothetical protein